MPERSVLACSLLYPALVLAVPMAGKTKANILCHQSVMFLLHILALCMRDQRRRMLALYPLSHVGTENQVFIFI